MDITAGTICLVKFPFTDQPNAKLRPALVAGADNPVFLSISDGADGPAALNVNFIQITSKVDPGLYNIVVDPATPAYVETGLPKTSTIRCWNINTIHKGFIERVLGKAPPALMEEVKEKLRARLQI